MGGMLATGKTQQYGIRSLIRSHGSRALSTIQTLRPFVLDPEQKQPRPTSWQPTIRIASRTTCTKPGTVPFRRHFLTSAPTPKHYEATVVGAGPAGITVVGNLLERNVQPLLWIDNSFTAGRVNARYREVPSNTKVKLFTDFATAVSPFRDIVGAPAANNGGDSLKMFKELDPEKGCHLSHAADMLLMLTDGLRQTPGVDAQQGRLTSGVLDDGNWSLEYDAEGQQQVAQSKRLVLCTGSSPNNSPLPVHIAGIKNVDLDDALSPSKLDSILSNAGRATIAVIGASHSAVLILRNLYFAAAKGAPIKIKWFTRHDLRYAEYMDGWILRDNTGLKGEAATWAKENLEPGTKSDVWNYITPVKYKAGAEKEVYAEHMTDVNYYVQAIGFDRDPTPRLTTVDGEELKPQFDHETGGFIVKAEAEPRKVPGLYGAGIAWPERVKDPYGNIEYAVGFFKFMKFVKRVSPQWN